tara:strand:- start:4452 stop:5513 length:1062 start_codon:yes stop_codon:yes gene_type:complete
MDIKTFTTIVPKLPSNISVLVSGGTGIGKSDLFHQIGADLGLPVIDRRLSQMTEGDIIGLPSLADGTTKFIPVDWIMKASREPVCLFLDEINRATVEVQQCAFQLVLDREINGVKLHPETRIYAAINEGSNYQVNDMGPALLRRFWAVKLEPTVDDWVNWARHRDDIDSVIVDFIDNNPQQLNHTTEFEPGKVYPNPASWHRLARSLKHCGWDPSKFCGGEVPEGFYSLCLGFVGIEPSSAFSSFIKKYDYQFSADDILINYAEKKPALMGLTNDKVNDLIEKLEYHAKTNDVWTVDQAHNACDFVRNFSGEMQVSFFNKMMDCGNLDTVMRVHKLIGREIVDLVNASNDLNR